MKLDKYAKLAIFVIIIGTLLRFILAILANPAGDGCWFLSVARFIAVNGKMPLFEHLGRDIFARPPLLPILGAFFYKIFGVFGSNAAEVGMRLVSPLFGSLILLFSFLTIKKMFNSKIAFYSVLFLSFIPIHFIFSSLSQVDIIVSFFVLLSIYFLLNDKIFLSGISVGLATLSKETGILILILFFYLLFRKYKNNLKVMFKKTAILVTPAFLVVLPWFIRNYIYLKNPIWPYLSTVIGGVQGGEMQLLAVSSNWLYLFYLKEHFITAYLESFGVPGGELYALSFFEVPFLKFLVAAWLLATIIFFIPFVLGLFKIDYKDKRTKLMIIWFLSYFLVVLYHVITTGKAYSRFLLPAFPVFAVVWAVGFDRISSFKAVKKPYSLLIVVCIIGFIAAGFVKTALTNNEWNLYQEDFKWVRENTEKNARFVTDGQCLAYQLNREVYPWNDKKLVFDSNSYVWVNQNLRLEHTSILEEDKVKEIEGNNSLSLVYFNDKTGTRVYHYSG